MKSENGKRPSRSCGVYRMGLYDVLDENEPIEFFGPRLTKAEAVSPAVRSVVTKLNNSLCVDPRTLRLCGIFRDDRSRRPASGT